MSEQTNTQATTGTTAPATGAGKVRSIVLKPKRPISSFFMYKKDRYNDVVAKNPNLKIAEITKIISDEWATVVSAEKKEEYRKTYSKKKEAYLKEMEVYKRWKAVHGDSDADLNIVSIDSTGKFQAQASLPLVILDVWRPTLPNRFIRI